MNKRGLTPLIATILLVVFALIIGAATMSWGQNYVGGVGYDEPDTFRSSVLIDIDSIDNPLKELQIKYITNQITLDEYLLQSDAIVAEMKKQ